MAKVVREELIRRLASGEFVSGQLLADALGVSRTAISKHIKALSDMGLDVFKVHGKGYRLAEPIYLLNAERIQEILLSLGASNPIEVHTIIDSTNSYLLRRLPNQVIDGQTCVAEYQSAGRGRRGKNWVSPFASHLYVSMYHSLEQGVAAAMGLSVVIGLAVADVLEQYYKLDVQLKWPNDIYIDGRKLAGILVELEGQPTEAGHSVIGLGLNIQMPEAQGQVIDQPWTDIASQLGQSVDRNILVARLISQFNRRLQQHKLYGLTPMLADWQRRDIFINQAVEIISANQLTRGICRGINANGALLIEINGKVKPIYGGEVSLRKQS
ncbi:bifunctional biotin--[acetyl-CoA-carboxylase] ligase/biotin operon repressor BirA [Thalassotalea sp. PS06]|uniref:bifunctional biotin--[acetyl-CoA-carboxylase] ligase/biotin operon repressor BirA n=1 Tax=Thalassotalea sp. PS06 TaxID=2594005 RepID=UPI00116275D7|nr:bifunctional biotin--[acetyl-CoA-carboxylase] ligase/biotin operon repressor BirA [Thalassotalea sp. PS06]QDP02531.1 bifunctional biotin--[acetyl-CoA-carboxylase] ligase/biotin operon repressor BirA [Thalassotalea sp. PS06]